MQDVRELLAKYGQVYSDELREEDRHRAGESWPVRPSGMAWESAERALITTEAGVAEVDLQRGGTMWRLPLPGVHGDAAVSADGSMWVLCGPAVARRRAAGGRRRL